MSLGIADVCPWCRYGWGEVTPNSIGIVVSSTSKRVVIDFVEQRGWSAKTSEIEVVYRVGSRVKVKDSVATPA